MSAYETHRKLRQASIMSPASITTAATENLARGLRRFPRKIVEHKADAAERTVENWLAGINGPGWKSVVLMLQDPQLCPVVLAAAGRQDLAEAADFRQKLEAAKAALDKLVT